MKMFRANASQRGFTLIELLIAMLIGVFLMAGVIQIFLSAKQAYRLQENLSRLQENGRLAMDIITKDVRMAGFTGCSSKVVTPTITAKALLALQAADATITAYRPINGNSANQTNCTQACKDIINLQSSSIPLLTTNTSTTCSNQLTATMASASATSTTLGPTLPVANTCKITAKDVLLIANCTQADIFVTDTTADPLSTAYGIGSEVFEFNPVSYYIKTGDGGIPALWRTRGTNPVVTEELVDGIENMQIFYGVDTDADYVPNYYVAANLVVNMCRVVSIRITLTARTLDGNLTTTGDGRIRRNFISTIAVRNRLR
jgi:type IV pilus assembly protein PilW